MKVIQFSTHRLTNKYWQGVQVGAKSKEWPNGEEAEEKAFKRRWPILGRLLEELAWPERGAGGRSAIRHVWCVLMMHDPHSGFPSSPGYLRAPKLAVRWSQWEVAIGCRHSFAGGRIPWMLPICEWSLTFHFAVDQFTTAGGTGSCVLRFVQCQAGPTHGPRPLAPWCLKSHPTVGTAF